MGVFGHHLALLPVQLLVFEKGDGQAFGDQVFEDFASAVRRVVADDHMVDLAEHSPHGKADQVDFVETACDAERGQ